MINPVDIPFQHVIDIEKLPPWHQEFIHYWRRRLDSGRSVLIRFNDQDQWFFILPLHWIEKSGLSKPEFNELVQAYNNFTPSPSCTFEDFYARMPQHCTRLEWRPDDYLSALYLLFWINRKLPSEIERKDRTNAVKWNDD